MSWTITGTQKIDPDAAVYLSRVEAADGQTLESGVRTAVNSFVSGCKNDSNWSSLTAAYLLAGARTLNGALIPLIGVNPVSVGFVSGDYNRKTGLASALGSYLNTGIRDDSLPQDSFHVSLYGTWADASINTASAGIYQSLSNWSALYQFSGSAYSGNRRNGGALANGTYTSPYFFGTSRSVSTGYTSRANLTSVSHTATSVAPSNLVHAAIGNNNNGTFVATSLNQRFAFYSIGSAVDLVALEGRVLTLMTALAAAIP